MISVQGVSMRFGSKVLFDDVTTTFQSGRRYGLTGPNGAGKATFMKLLTGEKTPPRPARPARRRKVHFHEAADRRTPSPAWHGGTPRQDWRAPAGPVRVRR